MHHEDEPELSGKHNLYQDFYNCYDFLKDNNYQITKRSLDLKPVHIVIARVFLELIEIEFHEQEYHPVPDARCNSGPPLQAHSLRGPPLC